MVELIEFPAYSQYRTCPYYWQDDSTGVLRRSIKYYTRQKCGNPPSLDALYHQEQLEILRRYFSNYVCAPCWKNGRYCHQIQALKDIIKLARTVEGLSKWHRLAIAIGIDPL